MWGLLLSTRGSIIGEILPRIVYVVVIALVVTIVHEFWYPFRSSLTVTPFSLIGLTLAIFLGFRNRVSYERFWEGRTMWGELHIVARNLARQTLTLPSPATGEALTAGERRDLIHRIIAFTHALRHYLRKTDPQTDLRRYLPEPEVKALLAASNLPNALVLNIGQAYARLCHAGRIDPILFAAIEHQVTRLAYILGGCERVQSTPIPFAFLLLLHRTVHIYCLLLPFGLIDTVGMMTPVVVCIVSYTFFGLDALGDQIEDPFSLRPNNLPLDAISRAVENNLLSMLGDANPPRLLQPVDTLLT